MKSTSFTVIVLACIFLFRVDLAYGQDGDIGIPDSVYVLGPRCEAKDCAGTVTEVVPLYLFSDDFYYRIFIGFSWQGDAQFERAVLHGSWSHATAGCYATIDSLQKKGNILISDPWHPFWPGSGVFAELEFRTTLGDTLTLSFPYDSCALVSYNLNAWPITYQDLNGSIPLPDTLAMASGDADCSGSVDISDAVFLITYIFAGGIPPYDMNAADENSDCAVDISDVVYLVAYIFSGGPAPQPAGCAAP